MASESASTTTGAGSTSALTIREIIPTNKNGRMFKKFPDEYWVLIESLNPLLEVFQNATVILSGVYYPTSPLKKLKKYFENIPSIITCAAALNPCFNVSGVDYLIENISRDLEFEDDGFATRSLDWFHESFQASSVASESAFSTSGRSVKDTSPLELPLDVEEGVFNVEVQQNEATQLTDQEIALDASSDGSSGEPRHDYMMSSGAEDDQTGEGGKIDMKNMAGSKAKAKKTVTDTAAFTTVYPKFAAVEQNEITSASKSDGIKFRVVSYNILAQFVKTLVDCSLPMRETCVDLRSQDGTTCSKHKEKLSGTNFNDWFARLKLVLRVKKKMHVIEQPLPPAPAPDSEPNVVAEWTATYDAYNEIACLMLGSMTSELHRQFESYYPFDMIQELRSMFEKQARVEKFDLIQSFHACKQEEGKPVADYILKMKGYVEQLERLGYMLPQDISVGLILNGLTKDFVGF
ncbi:hypothetical protein Tco_0808723, partial [Tanacetum coccineum]